MKSNDDGQTMIREVSGAARARATAGDIGDRQSPGVQSNEHARSRASQAVGPDLSALDEGSPPGDVDSAHPAAHRSYDRLSNEIVRLILHDKLRPNERLPSERVLSERLNVSRTSLREAIIALEIRGVVEVKSGSGIYVRALTPMSFLGESSTGPFELLRGRLIMEPEICAVAAIEAKDSDFDAIYQSIATMRTTIEDKRANELADRSFHVAIATATGNDMLGQIVGAVWDRRKGDMWEKIEEHFHTSALRQSSIDDHQRIFNALHARDPIMAKTQMKMHIERVIREFGKSW
jgi:DNA-binding FadR family transcriptional regulator